MYALRSGDEHRQLRYRECQIRVVEKPGERPYLQYVEDVSKDDQGGRSERYKEQVQGSNPPQQ